jgi:hypothetical protein
MTLLAAVGAGKVELSEMLVSKAKSDVKCDKRRWYIGFTPRVWRLSDGQR